MSVQTFVTFKNSTFNYRLNTLRKSAQEPYRWSTSKYCLNKEKAKHDELAFTGLDIIEIEDRAEIVKATKGGFYATVHYIYLTEEEVFLDQGEYTGEDEMDENGDIQPIFTDTKTVAAQREAEVVLYVSDVLVD
jgi:hypothetical protein